MIREFSLTFRRTAVVINYASAVLFVVCFCAAEYGRWNIWWIASCVLLFLILLVSYVNAHVRTGIFKVSRAKSRDLDERQIVIVHDAYRRAYHIFTVFCLVVFFFVFLTVRYSFFTLTHRGHYSFGLLLLLCLNYLLNTLPASVVAWTEPVVESGMG